MSLKLAVGDAAHVYTRALFDTLVTVQRGRTWGHKWVGKVFPFSIARFPRLLRALSVWLHFIQLFDGAPWMHPEHTSLRIQTDASGRRWGGVLKAADNSTTMEVGQEFAPDELSLDIETKEAMGVVRTIMGIAEHKGWQYLQGKRLNLWVDNMPLVFCIQKGASRNTHTHAQLELLFWLKLRYHFTTTAIWWSTTANFESDAITRTARSDDWRLSAQTFAELCAQWGTVRMDLMASTVNRQCDGNGIPLPFFSRFYCPESMGIDVLAQTLSPGRYYCFPHYKMVRAVVSHLSSMIGVELILIAPRRDTSWLPRVRAGLRGMVSLQRSAVTTTAGAQVTLDFNAYLLAFEG